MCASIMVITHHNFEWGNVQPLKEFATFSYETIQLESGSNDKINPSDIFTKKRCVMVFTSASYATLFIILCQEPLQFLHKDRDSSPPVSHSSIDHWMVTLAAAASTNFDMAALCYL